MLDAELVGGLAQFGTAGLIGWMWLTERRAAAARERELHEAHDRLIHERRALELLVQAVREQSRVLGAIEASQRSLLNLLTRWSHEGGVVRPRAPRRQESGDAA